MRAFSLDHIDPIFRYANTIDEVKNTAKYLLETEAMLYANDTNTKARAEIFTYIINTPFTMDGRTIRIE